MLSAIFPVRHALCHTLFFFPAFPPGPLPAHRLEAYRPEGRPLFPLRLPARRAYSSKRPEATFRYLFSVFRPLTSDLRPLTSVLKSLTSVLCLPSSVLRLTTSPFPKKPNTFSVRQSACRWQFPWQPASLWQSFYRFFQAPHKRL